MLGHGNLPTSPLVNFTKILNISQESGLALVVEGFGPRAQDSGARVRFAKRTNLCVALLVVGSLTAPNTSGRSGQRANSMLCHMYNI